MDSAAVACKDAELPSEPKKLRTDPSANGAPSPAGITAQGKEVRRYGDDLMEKLVRKLGFADSGERRRARDLVVPSSSQGDGAPKAKTMDQLLSLLEELPQTGFSSTAGVSRRLAHWVAKQDDDAVYLKVPMPGMGKEHVKVRAENNILVIKGEGDKDGDDDSAVLTYNHRIEMPAYAYKMDQIKGEMKNGVLWLIVLKVKEEHQDVFQVKIE